jgi:hypothetical protein
MLPRVPHFSPLLPEATAAGSGSSGWSLCNLTGVMSDEAIINSYVNRCRLRGIGSGKQKAHACASPIYCQSCTVPAMHIRARNVSEPSEVSEYHRVEDGRKNQTSSKIRGFTHPFESTNPNAMKQRIRRTVNEQQENESPCPRNEPRHDQCCKCCEKSAEPVVCTQAVSHRDIGRRKSACLRKGDFSTINRLPA